MVNPFEVSNTLQINVCLDNDNVLTIFTLPNIDMSRDDQKFSLGNFSKKIFLHHIKITHPRRRQAHHLLLDLEWNPFSAQ